MDELRMKKVANANDEIIVFFLALLCTFFFLLGIVEADLERSWIFQFSPFSVPQSNITTCFQTNRSISIE